MLEQVNSSKLRIWKHLCQYVLLLCPIFFNFLFDLRTKRINVANILKITGQILFLAQFLTKGEDGDHVVEKLLGSGLQLVVGQTSSDFRHIFAISLSDEIVHEVQQH